MSFTKQSGYESTILFYLRLGFICAYVIKDRDIPDAAKHVNNLNEMSRLLEEYQTELTQLNYEEKLFGFELSQFPLLYQIRALKDPYDSLWFTFANFQAKENLWMKGLK